MDPTTFLDTVIITVFNLSIDSNDQPNRTGYSLHGLMFENSKILFIRRFAQGPGKFQGNGRQA
jgi:hypothetical protein